MRYPLVVIGGGTGAIAAVSEALELGVENIALVERRKALGGECAMNGCVPVHTMLAGAHIFNEFKRASDFGINIPPLKLEFRGLMEKVEQTVAHAMEEDPFERESRVTRYHGHASFISPHEIKIESENGTETIEGAQIIVATGARPVVPEFPGLKDAGYWLYPDATHAKSFPASMAILGGGRIGVEFAQLFQRLGCRVALLEMQPRLLYREDTDASEALRELLIGEGVGVFTAAEIIGVELTEAGNGSPRKKISFLDADRVPQTLEVEEILVCSGRKGWVRDLNPEAAGLQYDDNGIIIDDRCRTTVEHIWAIGDVAGPYRFTHAADYQAVVAIQNAMKFREARANYASMPCAYYTQPPFARVGMTETQARENFQSVIVLQRQLVQSTRLRLEEETFGFCKIIVDGDTDQILGAHLLSSHADDIIHLVSLAMHAGISVPQMAQMVYAYPTRSQVIQKTLELYRQARTEVRKVAFGIYRTEA